MARAFQFDVGPDSRIEAVNRSPIDTPSGPAGIVQTVVFRLAGLRFCGLNGGPQFPHSEAVSFMVADDHAGPRAELREVSRRRSRAQLGAGEIRRGSRLGACRRRREREDPPGSRRGAEGGSRHFRLPSGGICAQSQAGAAHRALVRDRGAAVKSLRRDEHRQETCWLKWRGLVPFSPRVSPVRAFDAPSRKGRSRRSRKPRLRGGCRLNLGGSLWTLRWREKDSNHRSPEGARRRRGVASRSRRLFRWRGLSRADVSPLESLVVSRGTGGSKSCADLTSARGGGAHYNPAPGWPRDRLRCNLPPSA
jgi:hypothetical protein